MNQPFLLVNFKTFPHTYGKQALELAKIHERVSKETGVKIMIAVQAVDLRYVSEQVSIPVLAQHFDPVEAGAFTGHVTPASIKDCGAYGALLNHTEKKVGLELLESSIAMARFHDLTSVVCSESLYQAKAVSELDPDFVAVEPPELIGGDISVAKANPQIIQDAVALIGKNKVVVGAGIKSAEDVRLCLEFGAIGVLIASGVVSVADPEKVLFDLTKAF